MINIVTLIAKNVVRDHLWTSSNHSRREIRCDVNTSDLYPRDRCFFFEIPDFFGDRSDFRESRSHSPVSSRYTKLTSHSWRNAPRNLRYARVIARHRAIAMLPRRCVKARSRHAEARLRLFPLLRVSRYYAAFLSRENVFPFLPFRTRGRFHEAEATIAVGPPQCDLYARVVSEWERCATRGLSLTSRATYQS